jgi:DUF3037 family protein
MTENMSTAKGYYSILRYIPDLERGEGANIGVVLFCPALKFLRARTARGNDRVRRFFRSSELDLRRINAFKETFEERVSIEAERIETFEDFRTFIDTRANQLRLSEPRPVKIVDPEETLSELFEELVGGRLRGERAVEARRQLRLQFEELLHQRGVEEKVQRGVRVRLPIMDREISFPYMFRNGRPNLVKAEAFEGEVKRNIDRASVLAVEAIELKDDPEHYKLNVLASFRPGDNESPGHIRALLSKFDVAVHADQEVENLVRLIEETAH